MRALSVIVIGLVSTSILYLSKTQSARPVASAIAPSHFAPRKPDVALVHTPHAVVEKMLELAGVHSGDLLYDLGCGDGRIVVEAARQFGARGVGVDIDAECIRISRQNAEAAGVADLTAFQQGDIFQTDFSDASVVALFLLPHLNDRLLPQLMQLRPGTRIVSHQFSIDGYPADQLVVMPDHDGDGEEHRIYSWVTPLKPGRGYVRE